MCKFKNAEKSRFIMIFVYFSRETEFFSCEYCDFEPRFPAQNTRLKSRFHLLKFTHFSPT